MGVGVADFWLSNKLVAVSKHSLQILPLFEEEGSPILKIPFGSYLSLGNIDDVDFIVTGSRVSLSKIRRWFGPPQNIYSCIDKNSVVVYPKGYLRGFL